MICEYCRGKYDIIYGSGRFCSKECAKGFSTRSKRAEINKKVSLSLSGRPNNHKGRAGFKHSNSTIKKMQISNKINATIRSDKLIEKWLSGKLCPEGITKYIRRYLLIKYNNQCSKCGWRETNQFSMKIPLETHHIDGNKTNNKESNLDLLCPSCHSLTETFRGGSNRR